MKMTFKVSLKANERMYLNGAVIKVDRKTSIEFLNDVNFLLENHIMQIEAAETPLKQLYYIVQLMLMAPNDTDAAMNVFRPQMTLVLRAYDGNTSAKELKTIDRLVHERSFYEAMKAIRDLFKLEAENFEGDHSALVTCLSSTADAMRQVIGAGQKLTLAAE